MHHSILRYSLTLLTLVVACQAFSSSLVSFEGKVVGVTDGDTITVVVDEPCRANERCSKGKRSRQIRLAEIDTPEKNQPYGNVAKKALSDAVFGRIVLVEDTGERTYKRIVGQIYLDGEWINHQLVRGGHAWVYRKYLQHPELLSAETTARLEGIGLWRLPESQRVEPWNWRRLPKSQ